jgi:intein/homing endonuclease
MPYTDEFLKIRRRYSNQYSDKAKAETFAFEEAFTQGIPTFEPIKKRYKKQNVSLI